MKKLSLIRANAVALALAAISVWPAMGAPATSLPQYDLDVRIEPATHGLAVEGTVTFPASYAGREVEFLLAAPLAIDDLDADFHGTWVDELLAGQKEDVRILMALFDGEFFSEGVIAIDEANAESIVRACAAVRLVPVEG